MLVTLVFSVWLNKMFVTSCVCVCVLVTQLCLTLCDPIDCSMSGASVNGVLQPRILE